MRSRHSICWGVPPDVAFAITQIAWQHAVLCGGPSKREAERKAVFPPLPLGSSLIPHIAQHRHFPLLGRSVGPCNKHWFLGFLTRAKGGGVRGPREAPHIPPWAFPGPRGASRKELTEQWRLCFWAVGAPNTCPNILCTRSQDDQNERSHLGHPLAPILPTSY